MKFYSFILLLFFSMQCFAQKTMLSPQVISCAGGYYGTPDTTLSFTIGEIVTTTLDDGHHLIFTQGFQQPESKWNVGIMEINANDFSVCAYPNPVYDNLIVKVSGGTEQYYFIKVTDLTGKVMAIPDASIQMEDHQQMLLNLGSISSGLYFLTISYAHGKSSKTLKIEKVN